MSNQSVKFVVKYSAKGGASQRRNVVAKVDNDMNKTLSNVKDVLAAEHKCPAAEIQIFDIDAPVVRNKKSKSAVDVSSAKTDKPEPPKPETPAGPPEPPKKETKTDGETKPKDGDGKDDGKPADGKK